MTALVLGLIMFLGVHSVRIVADDWRTRTIADVGEARWKGVYSLVSLVGFVLIVWGYGLARQSPVILWIAPGWGRHAASSLMLISFVLLGAYGLRGSRLATAVRHPMLWAVIAFALAHLLANDTLADLLLFGGFGAWALLDLQAAYRRDRHAGRKPVPGGWPATAAAVGVGIGLWVAFAYWLHIWLIGVSPIARG